MRTLGQSLGKRANALLEMIECIVAGPGTGHAFDLFGQLLHLRGKPAHRLIGSNMGTHLAQGDDSALELRHGRRVALRDDEIDLVREAGDRIGEADQVFSRRQAVQGIAHFGQPMLDAAERAGVDAGLAAFGDALVEFLDLVFDGVEDAARHGVAERACDFGELVAQSIDRLLDARLAQGLDLIGDVAELLFQSRQIRRR